MKYFLSFIFATVALLGGAAVALAHATPTAYEPGLITFSERLEPSVSRVKVFDPSGDLVPSVTRVSDVDPHQLLTAWAGELAPGTYAVSWSVVSADDGHFTKGAYSFAIGDASASVATSNETHVAHSSTAGEAVTIFLELLGGAIFFASLLLPQFFSRRLVYFALLLIVLGDATYLTFKGAALATQLGEPFFSGLLNFGRTTAGSFSFWRIILALIALPFVPRPDARVGVNQRRWILMPLCLVMFYFRARVSHAAASTFYPDFSIFSNFLHLIGKSLWLGSVFVLAKQAWQRNLEAARVLSGLTRWALLLGGLTGVYMVWLHLKSFSYLDSSDWGARFTWLSFAALALVITRIIQEIFLRRGKILRSIFALELLAALATLFFSSWLVITTPPSPHFVLETKSGETPVTLETLTEHSGYLALTFHRLPKSGAGAIEELILSLTQTDEGLGPIVLPVFPVAPNEYHFPMNVFSPPGTWQISAAARRTSAYDVNATFTFTAPADFSVPSSHVRTLDTFTWINILVAVIILTIAGYLFKKIEV